MGAPGGAARGVSSSAARGGGDAPHGSSPSSSTSSRSRAEGAGGGGGRGGFGPLPPLPTRRVVVTGLGLVTPLGVGVPESWRRLLAGECGVRQLLETDLPESQRAAYASLSCRVAGLVPEQQVAALCARLGLAEEVRRCSRFMLLALLAAEEALADARWHPRPPPPGTFDVAAAAAGAGAAASAASGGASSSADGGGALTAAQLAATGVAIGNGMSCTTEVAEAGALVAGGKGRRVSPFFVPRILPNMAAGAVSIRHGFTGPNHAASTACATGAHAVGDAFRAVQRGDADVMVAGAAEACVDAVSLTGFSRLKALSTGFNQAPHQASRPFDARRDGFVMGEGAGVLVLEEEQHARRRGARIYAEVRGYGMSADGHHVTHPHPEGRGALLAMRRALRGSGLAPEQLCYVNAHATSTPAGDAIEQAAIAQLLREGEAGSAEGGGGGASSGGASSALQRLAVGSTKGATGHLLGAAGAVEAVFTVLALHTRRAPPTLNLEQPDPPLLPGLVRTAAVGLPPAGPLAALSNSFGFGGTNACLLLTTPEEAG